MKITGEFAVGGKVPSYVGSSFSFISVVIAATAYAGQARLDWQGTPGGGTRALLTLPLHAP